VRHRTKVQKEKGKGHPGGVGRDFEGVPLQGLEVVRMVYMKGPYVVWNHPADTQ